MSSLLPPTAIAPPLHSVPSSLLGQSLLTYGDPLHFRLRESKPSSNPVIFRSCFISRSRSLRCLCSADPKGTGSRPDEIVSGMVEKLLQREENKALLDGLEKASARVDRARNCALFGVTFRYTVRGDLDNFQLKPGACAAFSVIKGLLEVETIKTFELDTESLISFSINGALHVFENIFTFLAAAVALDF
ncbi:hypothetical protein ZIOFF_038139 [Zingiber officinale]|uniref:Uncharacterized protein n=1 Tax=Zingiber officinale TaxID=94328 RepID=A0A8J5GLN6_ZINOF|nr:hypothetical protein ZIOFF_038139 [Zingiber officinale]